jgi:predicted nucleic acid-binding protein
MILVDTNVLVALVLPKDPLHARAKADLKRLVRQEIRVLDGVMTETCFFLCKRAQRERLEELLFALRARQQSDPSWVSVFAWLSRYAEHEPDWVDAALVSSSNRDQRVWTYDGEFQSIWRRMDGSRVPLAVK